MTVRIFIFGHVFKKLYWNSPSDKRDKKLRKYSVLKRTDVIKGIEKMVVNPNNDD